MNNEDSLVNSLIMALGWNMGLKSNNYHVPQGMFCCDCLYFIVDPECDGYCGHKGNREPVEQSAWQTRAMAIRASFPFVSTFGKCDVFKKRVR